MDKDLASRQEARSLALAAEAAQKQLSQMQQGQLDKIVAAIAEAFPKHALTLGQLAVEETGFGNPQDKAEKNRFASQEVYKAIIKEAPIPNVAVGGINAENGRIPLLCGAHGLASSAGILKAQDPVGEVRKMRRLLEEFVTV